VQADVDLGVSVTQSGHGHRQHVARLGVGGGDREGAAVLDAVLVADLAQVVDLAQDGLDASEHVLARLGDALEALAVAHEDVDSQFFLEFDDGFGDPGLRGVQGLGGFGEVEVAAGRFLNESKLVQVHIQMAILAN